MIISIREMLRRYHLEPAKSVYQDASDSILDFRLTIGDFVDVCGGEDACGQYWLLQRCIQYVTEREQSLKEFCETKERWEEIRTLFAEIKMNRQLKADYPAERIQELKREKKELSKRLRELSEEIDLEVVQAFGYDWKKKACFQYKNTVYISFFEDLKQLLPPIRDVQRIAGLQDVPLFVSNLGSLVKALEEEKEIGIVGGPCLFGIDEVLVHITRADGERVSFDCSCGRRCLRETKVEVDLEEYTKQYGGEIKDIVFENRKTGITRQEYDSLAYLFAFAQELSAKVVIPLPDLSYFKYADSDLGGLPEELKKQKLLEFAAECYKITDMYLDVIERFGQQYPQVEYTVVHHRDTVLCKRFYEKRAPYIENSSHMRKITNISGKKESVVDYITMLALPYYIYGIETIVQLDNVEETDSGRKCAKIHKGDIQLTQILYSEYLSSDKKNTIYNAPLEYKDYMNEFE